EGRWALSIRAANAVGAGIGILVLGWIAYQFLRPWESPIDNLPWPTSLLPYLGPPVLILIPSKLLRPKHHGDYWGFIGIGLMAVALACSLAADGLFGLLLLAYGLSVVNLLSRFQRYRIFAGTAST